MRFEGELQGGYGHISCVKNAQTLTEACWSRKASLGSGNPEGGADVAAKTYVGAACRGRRRGGVRVCPIFLPRFMVISIRASPVPTDFCQR
jgi:hypothetical protein